MSRFFSRMFFYGSSRRPGAVIWTLLTLIILAGIAGRAESAAPKFYFFSSIEGFSKEYPFEGLSSFYLYGEEIFVADKTGSRIYIFDLDGTPLFQFGKEKGVASPIDLFVSNNRIYVSQKDKGAIEIFNMRGDPVKKIARPVESFSPGWMTPLEEGGFLAVDRNTMEIFVFDGEDNFSYSFGGRYLFGSLGGLVAHNGNVYITVMDSSPVLRVFDIQGNYKTGFGAIGEGKDNFSMPSGVGVGPKGVIWIVDGFKHRVAGFDKEGKLVSDFGSFGRRNGFLNYPLNIDFNGDLYYVLEKGKRGRISVFKREE